MKIQNSLKTKDGKNPTSLGEAEKRGMSPQTLCLEDITEITEILERQRLERQEIQEVPLLMQGAKGPNKPLIEGMPPYEGPYCKSKACKACGSKGAKSEYTENSHMFFFEKGEEKNYAFIRRTCKNCGHTWLEIPLYLVPTIMAEKMTEGVKKA